MLIQNVLKYDKTNDFVQNGRHLVTKRKIVMNAKSFHIICVYKKQQEDCDHPVVDIYFIEIVNF